MEKARILIVEDEAIIAMEIENQLQSLGYEVTSMVDTGIKAIAKAEADKPDLILMDIRIKGEMDGIEAAEEIRNRFGIPVIFSTAYLDEERIDRAKITMPFGYVLKPIQERDLKVTIEMALYVAKVDSKRKKTEESLRENEEKFRSLSENSQDYIMRYDEHHRHLYQNSAAYHVSGFTPEEFIGKTHRELGFDEKLCNLWGEKITSVFKSGQSTNTFFRWETSEGTVYLDLRLSPEFDDQGKVTTVLGVSRDITKFKLAEKELQKAHGEAEQNALDLSRINEDLHIHQVELEQQNEELKKSQLQITELQNKYFDLYEMAPVGYLTFNKKGLIVETNLTGATMLGTEKSVLKGLGLSNFIDVESQDAFYSHRQQTIETKTQQTCELTLIRKDNSKFLARLESKAVFDDKGEFIQLNTNIIDIGKPT